MKNLYFLAVLLLLFGCAKEETPKIAAHAAKKYAVKFKLSGFSQTVAPFEKQASISADAVDEYAEVIYYFVYDSHGNFIHRLMQEIEDPNFGTITDSLAQGSYTIAVAATQKNYLFRSTAQTFEDFTASLPEAQIRLGGLPSNFIPKDIFFKKISLTVDSENVTQPLTLDRIAGKLEIDILDHVPGYSYLYVINEAYFFKLSNETTVEGSEQEHTVTTGNFCFLTLNTDHPITLKIYAYDSSNNLIAEKTVDNIDVDRNKRTILKGNLFEEEPKPANESFSINVNSAWDADSIVIDLY